jgi:hypothetical protein
VVSSMAVILQRGSATLPPSATLTSLEPRLEHLDASGIINPTRPRLHSTNLPLFREVNHALPRVAQTLCYLSSTHPSLQLSQTRHKYLSFCVIFIL